MRVNPDLLRRPAGRAIVHRRLAVMAGSPDWFRDSFRAEYDKQDAALGRFTLAIFGKTGVGKSTLINAIFGEEVARTGIGEPVTRGSHLYLDKIGHLGIVDTQGLEVGTGQQGDPLRAGQGDGADAPAAAERADPCGLVLRPRHGPTLRGHRGRLRPPAGRDGPAGDRGADPGAAPLGRRDRPRPLPPGRGAAGRADHGPAAADRRRPAVHDLRQGRRVRRAAGVRPAGSPRCHLSRCARRRPRSPRRGAADRLRPEGGGGAEVHNRRRRGAPRPRPRPRSRSPTPPCWCRSSWA